MTNDNIRNFQDRAERFSPRQSDLPPSDGGSISGGMEQRVTRLETHMEYVRKDLDALKDGQASLIASVSKLATKSDLDTWRWQWLATGLAIIALTVGGITGGLALIAKFTG